MLNLIAVQEKISEKVDNIFTELVKDFDLKSGDISPLNSLAVDDFKLVLQEFVITNKGDDTNDKTN